ncbi:MAG: Fe-S oxidoreductase [Crocinitomicaceae bacterium]|nr:Fe-S oxidoreductase [Crocinitomicaceae bacterium]|tara:strand:- start:1971 stop:3326 length:1356 start_codon:yes stop_codon:yes gene_type:complete
MGLGNLLFIAIVIAAAGLFYRNLSRIIKNIKLGKELDRSDHSSDRWKMMIRVALGQSKMVVRPVAGVLHILVYVGFVIINIEILEIIIDGIFGTHRVFASVLGAGYKPFIDSFELLALLVLVSCALFLVRRNIVRIPRFWKPEMKGWPASDANYILIMEILLMSAFLIMDAADTVLMNMDAETLMAAGNGKYIVPQMAGGQFVVSQYLIGMLPSNASTLILIERVCWWFHIIGILGFLNYLVISKHLHILLAFPNTYYSNLKDKGEFNNLASVKKEVQLMFDPDADPYAAPPEPEGPPETFGAKDATDLTWKQLLDAYTCTECGRCTSVCPANQTGKLLSPRKIMMDTRDRISEIGKGREKEGEEFNDGKSLLTDYITPEELWACTSCNACTDACPINIDPLSIIVDLRRYLVMEQSTAPAELNGMFTNIENNGAPWQFAQADRLNWKDES